MLSQTSYAHKKQTTVFRFDWPVFSIRFNYWTECDPGDHRQEWEQLEGLPGAVCYRRSWVSRDRLRRKHAERTVRSSDMGRGEARQGFQHGVLRREEYGILRVEEWAQERWEVLVRGQTNAAQGEAPFFNID